MVDRGKSHLAEPRQDDLEPHAALVGLRPGSLAWQIFELVALPEVMHGWRHPVRMTLPHRVVALVDVAFEILGGLACGSDGPIRVAADGDAPLAALGAVVEQETLGAALGDAQRKTFNLGIPA